MLRRAAIVTLVLAAVLASGGIPHSAIVLPAATAQVVTCADFVTQAEAQAAYRAEPGRLRRLDGDGNGIACEARSCPCDRQPVAVDRHPRVAPTVILRLRDLPPGWSPLVPSLGRTDQMLDCGVEAPGPFVGAGEPEVLYTDSSRTRYVSQTLNLLDPAAAMAMMAELRALPMTCSWQDREFDGSTSEWSFRALPFPMIGDDMLARWGQQVVGAFVATFDEVIWRRGSVVVQIDNASIGETPLDTTLTEQLVRLIDERIQSTPSILAPPLPPFEVWQAAALAPEDVGPNASVWLDAPRIPRIGPAGERGEGFSRVLAQEISPGRLVEINLFAGDEVSPSDALTASTFLPGPQRDGDEEITLPPTLGPQAMARAGPIGTARGPATIARIAWPYGDWTILLTILMYGDEESARAESVRLAELQQEKLIATFSRMSVP